MIHGYSRKPALEATLIDLLDSVSLAGSRLKPNEDAFGAISTRAWVIDGATGLGDPIIPGSSDAAWIARRASYLFYRFAHIGDTVEMLMQVAAELEKAFLRERGRAPQERWEIPCAAFMMLTARVGGQVEVAHLGDCRLLLRSHDGISHAIGATAESEKQEARFAAQFQATGAEARYRSPKALEALRAGRALANTAPEFGGVLAPDPAFVPLVKIERFPLVRPAHALLMTDGFAALSLRYHDMADEALVTAALASGLVRLGARLRKIEDDIDPDGAHYPRWKRSDDATAMLLSLT
ncbi:MAG: protein phosphatase 2C domain-containing protein [Beijerinckiaceae bacterium]